MWSGVDVTLFDASSGYLLRRPTPAHHLTMCLTPTRSICRCEGPARLLQQRVGDIDLVPAGSEAAWDDEGPASFVSIDITPALLRSTADMLGVNPERVEIVPGLLLKDPQLTYVVWALKAELENGEDHDRLYAESLGTALAARLVRRYSKVRIRIQLGAFPRAS